MSTCRTRFLSIWTLLCYFCVLFSVLFLAPVTSLQRVWAASDPITVTAQTYTVHFPGSIDFSVSARDSASPINKAILALTIGGLLETHVVNINRATTSIIAQWHEDTSSGNFHPPGTQVVYYWELLDNAGNTHTSTSQEFRTIDTRFAWQHLTQGFLQVNWYNRSQDFGQIMLTQASASIERISQTLGGGLTAPINLWIYETPQDFQGSLAPNSYEWVGGQALPSLNEASIAVAGPSDYTLVRDMPHELTHLVFHQLIAHGIFAPTWFDEGLAVYNQTYHEPEMEQIFDKALANHSLLQVDEIWHGFPPDPKPAYLAYAESWKLLDYMYNTFGQEKMGQLIRKMNDPATDLDQDFKQVLGEDHHQVENAWRLHYHQPPASADQVIPTPQPSLHSRSLQKTSDGTAMLLSVIGLVLVLGSLGTIVLIVVTMRRKKVHRIDGDMIEGPIYRAPTGWRHNDSMFPASFVPGQEYRDQQPRRQAPQE